MIFWRGEGSRRAGAGLRFAEEWAAEEILDQVGSRLAAGVALCKALGARLPSGGVPFTRVKGTKTRLGLRPKTP